MPTSLRWSAGRDGFRLDEVWRGAYRPERLEYAFDVPERLPTFGVSAP